jgi:uncharacterized protein YndB with AHSA1/START domain
MTEAREGGKPPLDRTIEAEVRTVASPADVWRAWTTPEGLASWFVDRATGQAEAGEVLTWHWDRFGFEVRQIVREARPGERLVLQSDAPEGARLTEVTIRTDAGETVVRVVESGFRGSDDAAAGVASGWRMALALMGHALERHPGASRGQVLCLRRLPAGVTPHHPLYATEGGLREWLGRSRLADPTEAGVAVGDPAGPSTSPKPLAVLRDGEAQLILPGAGWFTGRRLLDTGRECLWQWSEVPALVEMKAFPAGAHWTVGLAVSAWGAAASTLAAAEPALRGAVERLVDAVTSAGSAAQ